MWEFILERAGYWAIIGLMMIGLFIAFSSENLIKRLVGLSLFMTTICLFYVTLGKVTGGTDIVTMSEAQEIELGRKMHPQILQQYGRYDDEALQQYVRKRLSAHAYPREIEFVSELPKTPSGKIQRFLLRNQEIAKAQAAASH